MGWCAFVAGVQHNMGRQSTFQPLIADHSLSQPGGDVNKRETTSASVVWLSGPIGRLAPTSLL